ncbi:unnamed protein product, partial [Coregonus sp. 'balchen']
VVRAELSRGKSFQSCSTCYLSLTFESFSRRSYPERLPVLSTYIFVLFSYFHTCQHVSLTHPSPTQTVDGYALMLTQEADGTLDCISMALTCTFNRWGTLLAVGCNDGRIVIWDFLTRGIAKIISAHIHPVCSLW